MRFAALSATLALVTAAVLCLAGRLWFAATRARANARIRDVGLDARVPIAPSIDAAVAEATGRPARW